VTDSFLPDQSQPEQACVHSSSSVRRLEARTIGTSERWRS
jgi:hypothetical protein